MRVLLDECVTRYLKRDLPGHEDFTVEETGFKGLKNGRLLQAAAGSYDVLITTRISRTSRTRTHSPSRS
jgi:hypothetical protein